MFVVFRCRKCGRHLYASESAKTKTCVCGYRNDLKRVRKLARAETEFEAGEIVRRLQGSGTEFDSLNRRLKR